MTLNYQRWTPPCGCSFEQEVNSETGEIKLLFAHSVCGGHEHIAKSSKSKALSNNDKNDIIAKKKQAWKRNRDKNLNDFENLDHIKRIKNRINAKALTTKTQDDLLLESHYYQEQQRIKNSLDNFEKDRHLEMLIGLESDYALDAQEVYNQILKEHKETAEKQSGV